MNWTEKIERKVKERNEKKRIQINEKNVPIRKRKERIANNLKYK